MDHQTTRGKPIKQAVWTDQMKRADIGCPPKELLQTFAQYAWEDSIHHRLKRRQDFSEPSPSVRVRCYIRVVLGQQIAAGTKH
ncbi:hypothetical protein D3H34_04745 [Acidovorax cavernicola]|uniref:Uncharacterized protein n=1 Tax=Acidovorax cavernicola TaxID=1675792 RepID=A0A9X8D7V3_9BURK|nr:hypothetical protein D3H34_04745 [Acidovorax cavernicola]